MSPVTNNASRISVGLDQAKAIAKQPRAADILKALSDQKMLDTQVKTWLKHEYPDLYQAITNMDTSASSGTLVFGGGAYPAGTRYAVIDKNEL